MSPLQELNKKYDHALLSMFDLYKVGREKEIELELKVQELEERLLNAKDRLRDILKQDDGQAYKEAEHFLEGDDKPD